MKLNLEGKTAVVTGASRGIGLATVQALRAEGVNVVGAARTVTMELEQSAGLPIAIDLTDSEAAKFLVASAVEQYGGVDLLVNNVGGGDNLNLAGFEHVTDDDWVDALQMNLMTAVRMSREALPLLARQGGTIVNVSSIGARRPEGPPLAYNVAKAALTAFGRGLAAELGSLGVRVVTVSPGPTRTAMWEGPAGLGSQLAAAMGAPLEQILAGAHDQVGMVTGRMAEPSEVASLITYLLSARAASITGADYLIDGGAIRSA